MCGRYTLATPAEELVEAFDAGALTFDWFARYNAAPGQELPILAEDGRGRRVGLMRWGFVPGWRDEPGPGLINARAESVARKRSFREAFARRRCLVPADGFYEWKRIDGAKQPFWIHPSGAGPISFAGIWETWRRPAVEPRHGFAILTTEANADVSPIHDRMPVVVQPGDRAKWLARSTTPEEVAAMLRAAPQGSFEARAVSTRVNRVGEDDPGLLEAVAE